MSSFQSSDISHFNTVYDLLPSGLKAGIDDLLSRAARESAAKHVLDQLLRFSLCRDAADGDLDSKEEWNSRKLKVQAALSKLSGGGASENGKKRPREEDDVGVQLSSEQPVKKAKTVPNEAGASDDLPIFALNSLSVASPIRKKVNIAIHRDTIRFINPTSGAQEALVSISAITRAFLIPTPGKSKPHWTVVLLTDTDQNQIIFGVDATPPSFSTTSESDAPQSQPKGTETKPALKEFLSHLPSSIPVREPSTSQFKSGSGEAFIDAYLRAKDGHLTFYQDGILFGEKKPCMWIGTEELESVRTLSATGRTFSIFAKRVPDAAAKQEDEEAEGEETEFSMVDGKHQDSVNEWIRTHQRSFGVAQKKQEEVSSAEQSNVNGDAAAAEGEKKADEDEDEDDSDFEMESDSDGGSDSEASSDEDGEGSGGDEEADTDEEDAEGDGEGEEEEEEEEKGAEGEELDPARHPLLAPGAMPRMSKAAIDMVVGMVEKDLMGKPSSSQVEEDELEDEDEVDELDG